MNCPHDKRRKGLIACDACIALARAKVPRTIAALAALMERIPAEREALWALTEAAIEEATAEANREAKERLDRIVSSFGFDPLTRYLRPRKP